MAQFSDGLKAKGARWPENLWAGTSITTQGTTTRIKHLLRVGDANTILFLSVEPQREEIDLREWLPHLDWIIQGGESGSSTHPFQLEWALNLIRQCGEVGVAYFLKQFGRAVFSEGHRLRFSDNHAGDWSEWPKEVRVRQLPRRIVAKLYEDRFLPLWAAVDHSEPANRTPLEVIEGQNNGRQAALKAWETRRRKQQEQKRTDAALKAWKTRRENERKKKRSEAARKAWRTRRGNERDGAG
jgi:hypothetical protein